ncbi:acyl-CoA dehydrogenase family protein [Streptomyces sp. NPDC014991]|uniref:acyl-CoA dehydrogenase family protein n=1 Tax=Streptomyces sp. NPDC014991 TaxID=3364935 RepID=UPI00370050FC
MRLAPTDEQTALAGRLHQLGTTLGADLDEREHTQTLHPGDWQRCADAGVFALPVPEEYGGLGQDPLTCALALEGLGRGCRDNGLMISAGAHLWAVELPLLHYGSEEQKRRHLPALVDGGSIGAHAITEAGSGSDALSLSTVARREGDHYVLNGTKRFITNAPVADLFIVYATINPDLGFTGVTAFLVERDTPGLTVETRFDKTGLRTAPWGEVVLRDCRVPAGNRLGAEKQGSRILATAMAWERSLILAPLLGTMQRQIDECTRYARSREQFGSIIGRFPSVSHSVVGMQVRLEAARLLTYRAAWDLGQGVTTSLFPEAAQLETSESAVRSFLDAVQLFGGLGFTTGNDAERNLRDALGTRISSGTSDMQRTVMADKLGLTVRARTTADGRHTP